MQHLWGTVDRVSVTAPRDLREDQIIKVTCRCVNRGYRLTPTPEVGCTESTDGAIWVRRYAPQGVRGFSPLRRPGKETQRARPLIIFR